MRIKTHRITNCMTIQAYIRCLWILMSIKTNRIAYCVTIQSNLRSLRIRITRCTHCSRLQCKQRVLFRQNCTNPRNWTKSTSTTSPRKCLFMKSRSCLIIIIIQIQIVFGTFLSFSFSKCVKLRVNDLPLTIDLLWS